MADISAKLGGIYNQEAKYSEAEATFERAQVILDQSAGHTSSATTPDLLQLLNNLAWIDYQQKQYNNAAARLSRTVNLFDKGLRRRADEAALILLNYAACLRKIEHKKQAKEFEARAEGVLSDLPRGGEAQVGGGYHSAFAREVGGPITSQAAPGRLAFVSDVQMISGRRPPHHIRTIARASR